MVRVRRIYGGRVSSFRAIFVPISHLNKSGRKLGFRYSRLLGTWGAYREHGRGPRLLHSGPCSGSGFVRRVGLEAAARLGQCSLVRTLRRFPRGNLGELLLPLVTRCWGPGKADIFGRTFKCVSPRV
jgi:hypothetical protein